MFDRVLMHHCNYGSSYRRCSLFRITSARDCFCSYSTRELRDCLQLKCIFSHYSTNTGGINTLILAFFHSQWKVKEKETKAKNHIKTKTRIWISLFRSFWDYQIMNEFSENLLKWTVSSYAQKQDLRWREIWESRDICTEFLSKNLCWCLFLFNCGLLTYKIIHSSVLLQLPPQAKRN